MAKIILPADVQQYLKANYGFELKTDIDLVARLVTHLVNSIQVLNAQRAHLEQRIAQHNALSRDAQDLRNMYGKTDAERELEKMVRELSEDKADLELKLAASEVANEFAETAKPLEEQAEAAEEATHKAPVMRVPVALYVVR